MPYRSSAAAVPLPIAATRTPASARLSTPARRKPCSKNTSTPFADVNTTHAYCARSGIANSSGSTAIVGNSSTSAPIASSHDRNALDCSRARVTTTRLPNNGRVSNHAKSSAATSPTTIADGASTPASAMVARVARTVCCSGRVPQRTAATGVESGRPPAIKAFAISREPARAHEDDERAARLRERVPVGIGTSLGRIFVTGDDRDARRNTAVRHRDPGIRSRCDRARHPGNNFERDAGRNTGFGFLAAAPEHERVAAFEPHHVLARTPVFDKQGVDLVLRHRGARPALCRRRRVRHAGRASSSNAGEASRS